MAPRIATEEAVAEAGLPQDERGPASPPRRPRRSAGTSEDEVHACGHLADKDALVKRLHRIAGQVRGIERMLEQDRYCIDLITQIAAASTALESLAFEILHQHVDHCVAGALGSGDPEEGERKSRELLEAVERFVRTR